MPIRIKKKTKKPNSLVVEGTAQLLDETALDEPVVLKQCAWVGRLERGKVLWDIQIESGDDLRGYVQAELQKRTKRS